MRCCISTQISVELFLLLNSSFFFVLATQIYTVRQQPAALVRRRFGVLVLPFNVRPSGLKTQPVRSSPDSVSALKRSRGCTKRHTATYELRPLPPANAAAACIPSQTLSVNFRAKREKKKKKTYARTHGYYGISAEMVQREKGRRCAVCLESRHEAH